MLIYFRGCLTCIIHIQIWQKYITPIDIHYQFHQVTPPTPKTGPSKNLTLKVGEFIRRFLQHILPEGFSEIRYFGFLALRHLKKNMDQCLVLLRKTVYMPRLAGLNSREVIQIITDKNPLSMPGLLQRQDDRSTTGKPELIIPPTGTFFDIVKSTYHGCKKQPGKPMPLKQPLPGNEPPERPKSLNNPNFTTPKKNL